MTAGFCWDWSKHNADRALNDDVVIGNYKRPWNARHEAVKLPKGVPKAQFWAHDPNGIEQIGCVYTAQGFEFDYIGVIFGNDIMYSFEEGKWIGYPGNSKDPVVRGAKGKFIELVKNTYRVLLSRGLKGCYVYFLDKDTEKFFLSRMEIPAGMGRERREQELQPYVNALPLVKAPDLENIGSSEWRCILERGWAGEFIRMTSGPFLRDRFLVQAEDSSMEPLIPKNSLCEFHVQTDEDLDGKVVLCRITGYAKRIPSVVMKKYQRFMFGRSGGIGETTKIILSSGNRAYPSLELRLGIDKIEILGVFDRILHR